VNHDPVKNDPHERARMLIALSGPEQQSNEETPIAERSWLAAHLESCASCREFADSSAEAIRSLRAIPIMAGASLVSATRVRVRQRAQELQRHQERMRVIWVCCLAVTLCTALSTAVLWRGLAWMSQQWIGQQAWLPAPVWEIALVAISVMPAVVAGILLISRGTYMADHNGTFQG
jgi:predicted anti-sigma-YlaC factor YlaD